MLVFPFEEERHFGLKRRTTRNKIFVPNYEAKMATNYCFSSQIEQACPKEPCCCVGPEKFVANGIDLSDDLRRLAKIVLALGWVFSNQYFAGKACFNVHHTPLSFQPVIKGGAYFCYCAYARRISRYSCFPVWVVLTNTGIFLRGLKLCGVSRT